MDKQKRGYYMSSLLQLYVGLYYLNARCLMDVSDILLPLTFCRYKRR